MALLTSDIQEKLITLLAEEGLVRREVLEQAEKDAAETGKPLFALLTSQNIVAEESLTHAIAQVSGVPYVNLSNSLIDQNVLSLLPEDIAERFMAVPLAEVQNRLAVAMIDANNVQAVDYLANRIQRPLKVFMASEAGVRHVLISTAPTSRVSMPPPKLRRWKPISKRPVTSRPLCRIRRLVVR